MFERLFSTLIFSKCSVAYKSNKNKQKSVDAKSGGYGGSGRTSHHNDLIFWWGVCAM